MTDERIAELMGWHISGIAEARAATAPTVGEAIVLRVLKLALIAEQEERARCASQEGGRNE